VLNFEKGNLNEYLCGKELKNKKANPGCFLENFGGNIF
jgi:hypothetical protein